MSRISASSRSCDARVDLVEPAREAAEPDLLLLGEVLHEDPAVLEERALVLRPVPEGLLERDEPRALLRALVAASRGTGP